MNTAQREALARELQVIEEEMNRRSQYKLRQYFPAEGPLRRDLYTGAMRFFTGGVEFPERLLMGGNRCISPWTPIQTPRGEHLISEMLHETSFDVQSSDGDSRRTSPASGVFLKGIEPAFRIHLDNGAMFDASWNHRLWDGRKWSSLGQLIRASSGRRYWKTDAGSTANCATRYRLGDAQPPETSSSVSAQPPSRFDVQGESPSKYVQRGVAGRRLEYIRQGLFSAPSPTVDDPDQIEDLCGSFEDPTAALDVEWCSQTRRELSKSVHAWFHCQGDIAGHPDLPPHVDDVWLQSPVGPEGPRACHTGQQGTERWPIRFPLLATWTRFRESGIGRVLFCPYDLWIGGEKVESIVPIGYSPILDFTVEKVHNYYSGGVLHHNTGKTDACGFECALHLTGLYPDWWPGRRFTKPVNMWAAGDTATTTRNIMQLILYGPVPSAPRTGMIPGHLIKYTSNKNAVPGAIETMMVKHVSGADSALQFKSFDQRRESFQGTSQHVIWLDEECPADVYTECVLRTLTVQGIMMVSFTPVEGLTPFVDDWLKQSVMLVEKNGVSVRVDAESSIFGVAAVKEDEGEDIDQKLTNAATAAAATKATEKIPLEQRNKLTTLVAWDEVPHLSPQARQQMLASIPPYQRAARTQGIPNLGSGVIYAVPEEDIRVKPFKIPDHWMRGFGMDVGWNWTSAVWGAYDPETSTWYLYYEHNRSHAEPAVHAAGIKAVGDLPGRIDPAANGRSQVDGKQLIQLYTDLGLRIENAPNAVEAGIYQVWTLLTSGRLKIFSTMQGFFGEYRMYRRDGKGRVVKKNDHLMDAARYLLADGPQWLGYIQPTTDNGSNRENASQQHNYGWMG